MTAMDAPKKPDVEKRLITVLLCILGVSVFWGLKNAGLITFPAPRSAPVQPVAVSAPAKATKTAKPGAHQGSPEVGPRPPAVVSRQPDQWTYTAATLRDPLQSQLPGSKKPEVRPSQEGSGHGMASSAGEVRLPTLTIQGLIWGGPKPKAIIDNEVYGVGDVVQGATITEIGREGITLELQGRTIRMAIARQLAQEDAWPLPTRTRPGSGR